MDPLDEDIARWDYLITPSRAGTDLLRTAFGYTGAVLETGYPRNDVLNAADSVDRRAQVRRELGIGEDETVVLYAPTFRDDDAVELDTPFTLDAPGLAARLGDGYRLLLRRHYFLGARSPFSGHDRVRDVSAYADVSGLYLAADVLVSDYSSVIFDFAVTGKPILLFAYDLEHYRDRLRGFTMDLAVDMPGPVLEYQADLETALLNLPEVTADYAERYAVFRDRYCHLDDGHATERVVAQLRPR
jgi:CDP-glycerol glycerophosphotransferase